MWVVGTPTQSHLWAAGGRERGEVDAGFHAQERRLEGGTSNYPTAGWHEAAGKEEAKWRKRKEGRRKEKGDRRRME